MSPSDINSLWLLFKQTINKVVSLFVPSHHVGQNASCKKLKGPAYPAHIKLALGHKLYYWRVKHYFGGMARCNMQAHKCKKFI